MAHFQDGRRPDPEDHVGVSRLIAQADLYEPFRYSVSGQRQSEPGSGNDLWSGAAVHVADAPARYCNTLAGKPVLSSRCARNNHRFSRSMGSSFGETKAFA
jgi:hypothetical protein